MTIRSVEDLEMPYFDLTDPSIAGDPYPVARELGRSHWIARTPTAYMLFHYADWVAAANDPRMTTPEGLALPAQGITSKIVIDWASSTLQGMQGEQHDRVRRIAMPSFGARSAEAVRAHARELITGIYAPIVAGGRADVAKLNNQFVARMICKTIGFPDSDWGLVSRWADDANLVVAMDSAQHIPRIEQTILELNAYTTHQLERLRREPDDSLASRLLVAEAAGDRLSSEEVVNLLEAVMMAGAETSTRMLSLGLWLFTRYPGFWAELRDDPELAAPAVEEILRHRPPLLAAMRVLTDDVEMHGVRIPKGASLLLCPTSANNDPARFEQPEQFDIHRYRGATARMNHMTFGSGPRVCIGRFLARVELQEALKHLAGALGTIAIDETDAEGVKWSSPLAIHGPVRLPLRWEAR